jgi:hypothetical protein
MRLSISLILIFVFLICSTAKKNPDEDFSEFDDFDQDEFVIGKLKQFITILLFYYLFRNSINNHCYSNIIKTRIRKKRRSISTRI